MVATVGLLLVVSGLSTIIYGPAEIRGLPQLPAHQDLPSSPSVNVGYDQVILVAVGLAVTSSASSVMLRKTRLGLAMRAVVDDPALLELTGFKAPSPCAAPPG